MDNMDDLIASLSKEVTPLKPAPHPLRLGLKWLAIATAYLAVTLSIFGVRPDLMQQFIKPVFSAEIMALCGIFIASALSAAVLSFPDLHQKRALAFAPLLMFALFVGVMGFAWHADQPPAPLPMHSFECTLSILMFSLLPALAIFNVLRRYASTHLSYSGIAALLFAFSTGALWLRLYEATDSVVHLIEWHYLPIMGVILVGGWLGKTVLKW
ncbi:MAG: DUF1109 domain-containing protein [Gallionella sp.]|nr:DUF1109 domain-containing protein [Gallionella sp.]MDD4947838.1 DUF1109 domain-containing protein [Gallionella sp.]